MNNEELNKKLTGWLGLCWHEFEPIAGEYDFFTDYCTKCGKPNYEYNFEEKTWYPINRNMDFTSSFDTCIRHFIKLSSENPAF